MRLSGGSRGTGRAAAEWLRVLENRAAGVVSETPGCAVNGKYDEAKSSPLENRSAQRVALAVEVL
jgi:hypothetical protein